MEEDMKEKTLDPIGTFMVENLGMDKQVLLDKTEEEKEEARGHTISASSVNWVDSRATDGEWPSNIFVNLPSFYRHSVKQKMQLIIN